MSILFFWFLVCMCVVGHLITRERSREERYCVSRFSDSPHLLISSKSRPNGATKIDLAKHTRSPGCFSGPLSFPLLCSSFYSRLHAVWLFCFACLVKNAFSLLPCDYAAHEAGRKPSPCWVVSDYQFHCNTLNFEKRHNCTNWTPAEDADTRETWLL